MQNWYKKVLRGAYAAELGSELLTCLCIEIANVFPAVDDMPEVLRKRNYKSITAVFFGYDMVHIMLKMGFCIFSKE